MSGHSITFNNKKAKWAVIGGAALIAVLLLSRCGGSNADGIDMSTATCESLIPHVIEMSKGKDLEVFEITEPKTGSWTHAPQNIDCSGRAEWSRGDGFISYGARVSDGGQVILQYKQD